MPKQIDHEAYRLELARKAAPLFSELGYSGLGMRQVAEALGLSKSALYHYFPTKKSLFLACTETVMREMTAGGDTAPHSKSPKSQEPATALIDFAKSLEPGFASEMSLLFDYLRGKTATEIAADPAMQLANDHLRRHVEGLVGSEAADSALCLLMGALLMRHFTGGTLDYETLLPALRKLG
ncbi:TetR/AcrR family transcriptional regulator [Stappia sp. BW2]|uniref:TetR/AcrR family transcriptional regulator n=1 Tax=Stappia sp. BW2 TaxID=2592622 RepID=UPI0011DE8A01|nr:TetR/AcrR family transcriptional regulator [Stappia sp. BW2]TYC72264.1 TetR/AcrR family transcriptional regulator [Stappia sp. BW2]